VVARVMSTENGAEVAAAWLANHSANHLGARPAILAITVSGIENDSSSTSALTTRSVRKWRTSLRSSHQAQINVASNIIGDGKGLDYPLCAAPIAILIGDPQLARSADRVADRRRQVALCGNRRSALRDIDWRVSQ